MTSFDWVLVNIGVLMLFGRACFLFGYIKGMCLTRREYGWSQGYEDCRSAIMEGLSEEGKALVELYTGKDEENEDC